MGERSTFIQMSFFENRSGVTKLLSTLPTLYQVVLNGKMQGCGVVVGMFRLRLRLRAPDRLRLPLRLRLRVRYEI